MSSCEKEKVEWLKSLSVMRIEGIITRDREGKLIQIFGDFTDLMELIQEKINGGRDE